MKSQVVILNKLDDLRTFRGERLIGEKIIVFEQRELLIAHKLWHLVFTEESLQTQSAN